MRTRMLAMIVVILACRSLKAQVYEYASIGRPSEPAPSGALKRWRTSANGVAVNISMTVPPHGPWSEGMQVDGSAPGQLIHWYLQDNHYHLRF
jgi:hypothetical protein